MIIDAGDVNCALITGSFIFTFATQHRIAENAVVPRGDPPLCNAYRDNWQCHRAHVLRTTTAKYKPRAKMSLVFSCCFPS